MHLHDTGMRRLVSVLGFLAVAGLPVANVASASVTPSRAAERTTAPIFVLQSTIAGGLKTVQISCEPGFVQHGQSVSMVITTHVSGDAGTVASVRVCLSNENVGVVAPCKTVSAKIA
jgi:hypothetical protein